MDDGAQLLASLTKGYLAATAAWKQADTQLSELQEALKACQDLLAFHPRDWAAGSSDATLWGILVGWECEDDHAHDGFCGADGGVLAEVSARHRWDEQAVERVRRLHRAVAALNQARE